MRLDIDQFDIVVDLIRRHARILRRERFKPLRYINRLVWAQEANIPEQYLMPYSCCLRQAIDWNLFDSSTLPPGVGSLFNKSKRCSSDNRAALENFGARILEEYKVSTEDAVLTGEAGALTALYSDAGAFRATKCEALLSNGACANGDNPKQYGPLEEEWSERIQFGSSCWRKPKPSLLIAMLASRVGDPVASPIPPIWTHLGLAMLVYKNRIAVDEILDKGKKINQQDEVERGLAIAAYLFPELAKWTKPEKLGIPAWERKFAIPIAARRIAIGERD